MSAFLVSQRHIAYLVEAAHRCDDGMFYWSHGRDERGWPIMRRLRDVSDQELGKMLFEENIKSIKHRYPDDPFCGGKRPKYRHKRSHLPFEHAQALKAIHCLEYQSCEHDGWEESEAFAFLKALESHLVSSLPGYSEAKWAIEEED